MPSEKSKCSLLKFGKNKHYGRLLGHRAYVNRSSKGQNHVNPNHSSRYCVVIITQWACGWFQTQHLHFAMNTFSFLCEHHQKTTPSLLRLQWTFSHPVFNYLRSLQEKAALILKMLEHTWKLQKTVCLSLLTPKNKSYEVKWLKSRSWFDSISSKL